MSFSRYGIDKEAYELKPKFLYLTRSNFENDLISSLHFHPFVEIIFITSGDGEVLFDNNSRRVHKGDLILINPNTLHTEKSDNNMECQIVGVDNLKFNFMNEENPKDFLPIFDFSGMFNKTKYYFDEIRGEITSQSAYFQTAVANIVTNLIIFITRNCQLLTSEEENRFMSKECSFVKQYLDSHYANPLPIKELAKKAYISEGYLIRSFNKYLGVSPAAYMKNVRIKEACILLLTTDQSITKIGEDVGFASPSHFGLAFRNIMSTTPMEFRKQNK